VHATPHRQGEGMQILMRALAPTVLAFAATTSVALVVGAHLWVGLLAGFPAAFVVEAVLAHLADARQRRCLAIVQVGA
jgi:hypothetical protein